MQVGIWRGDRPVLLHDEMCQRTTNASGWIGCFLAQRTLRNLGQPSIILDRIHMLALLPCCRNDLLWLACVGCTAPFLAEQISGAYIPEACSGAVFGMVLLCLAIPSSTLGLDRCNGFDPVSIPGCSPTSLCIAASL